ncbi:hypothetical protein SOVF_173670 isoform B [Spinacia oleracea]|uniref:Uncharacterized protein isoform X1 n=1 Tax=Spinacia oleracea TaxID=3562 RepID=A0A9R0JN15_SPIOL|nr:uncharacterized protein LOC110780156 isoform X1 [Spinacia oleracea]KNA07241.1 hypothetical protein SOVF_173670 isoform B [Spinacia oleracea]
MDNHSEWVRLDSFQPNGLLLKESASVTRPLDPGRWAIAEERIKELIARIQPSWASEERRLAVATYVQSLIGKCVPCQVFTFGSVPLKTYLPDGDIDLTAFSEDPKLKDNWANSVLDMLRREEKNEHAEFQVKEVQYIQAEVKIIKCLVDNIVVDISFNQLGGLCTLCFLEEVDNLINQNHLFKRSIILIKAWCYYESRILGAHHGLISTYALETLVLYIFHVFNNSFSGPLEVLYRFVEFFSKFDWANFCISLWGPIPICSLPSMTADPPRKDGAVLLLNKMFLNACNTAYSVLPGGQDTQEQPFISKHFNVVDPLRINNNLGRSVSKGNFYRIRSAFSFGAQQLARILECQEENIVAEVNQFFVNTWDRHGKCPDTPVSDASHMRPINSKHDGNRRKHKPVDNPTENLSLYPQIEESRSSVDFSMQPSICHANQIAGAMDVHKDLHSPAQKDHERESRTHLSSGWDQYYTQKKNPTKKQQNERERNSMANILQSKGHATPQFARTSSSPELTNMSSEAAPLRRHNTAKERVNEVSSSRSEYNRRMRGSGMMTNPVVNCYVRKPVSGSAKPVVSSVDESSQRLQEGQDFVNLMSSSGVQKHGGHVQMPVNLASHHFVTVSPSIPGTRPQKYTGTRPLNPAAPQSDWGEVIHHPERTSVGPAYRQLISVGVTPEEEIRGGLNRGGSASIEVNHLDDEHGYWTNRKADSMRESDHESEEFATAGSRLSPASPSNSYKTKSSDSSWDVKPSKINNAVRYPGTKKSSSSKNPTAVVNSRWLDDEGSVDHTYDDFDDKSASSSTSSHIEVHQLPGFRQTHMSYQNSVYPFSPMLVRPGPQQGMSHNHPVLPVAFYPAGLPVPFVTMVPVYNMGAETGTSAASSSHDDTEMEKSTFRLTQSSHNSDSPKGVEHSSRSNSSGSTKRITSREDDECERDIFNSDFASHWKNLQYGRLCQNPQFQHPFFYPPSVYVPPVHLQGNIPFDAPRSPYSGNSNVFVHPVPVSEAQQPSSVKPASVSRQYGGELPKQRNGTGTYFPNPKVFRDQQYSTSRQYQGDSKHDRNEHHGEREANWNPSSKPRFSNRAQPRYRNDKPNSKIDRSVASDSQTDRHFDSFRKNSYQLYRFPKEPSTSKSTWNGRYDTDYSVYQTRSEYHNEVSQSGDAHAHAHAPPPLVMFYPYPQTVTYDSQIERQFGSSGREQIVGTDEVQEQLQNYQGDTGPPSPDYASPPRFLRGDGV